MAVVPVSQVQPPAVVAALPACMADTLRVSFDAMGDSFAGMSHDGTYLVVRNVGSIACRVPGLPVLRFENEAGQRLPIERQVPPGMHPGPVVLPIVLAAGAQARAGLLWVDAPVFGDTGGRCFKPMSATVIFADGSLGAAISATICGSGDRPATFQQKPLAVHPVNAP